MARKKCAGYTLKEALPTTVEGVEHWRAEGPDGQADIYLGSAALRDRVASLPKWGPFSEYSVGEDKHGVHVVVPGVLEQNLGVLGSRHEPDVCLSLIHI